MTETITIPLVEYQALMAKAETLDKLFGSRQEVIVGPAQTKEALTSWDRKVAEDMKFQEIRRQVQIMKRMTDTVSHFLKQIAGHMPGAEAKEGMRAVAYMIAPENFEQFAHLNPGDLMGMYGIRTPKIKKEKTLQIGKQDVATGSN